LVELRNVVFLLISPTVRLVDVNPTLCSDFSFDDPEMVRRE
jgi:hypothetical protein